MLGRLKFVPIITVGKLTVCYLLGVWAYVNSNKYKQDQCLLGHINDVVNHTIIGREPFGQTRPPQR